MSDKQYDKMKEFVETIFHVFTLVNKRAEIQRDKRLKIIGLTIYNYVKKIAIDLNVDLKTISNTEYINLIPVFEYIAFKNIELYDFSKIDVNDVDVTNNADLERFVLTHIYHITQSVKI